MKIKKWWGLNILSLLLMPGLIIFIFFLIIPLIEIIRTSFYENIPGAYMKMVWTLENYKDFLGSLWFIRNVLLFSLRIALITTFFAMFFAYPPTYYIVRSARNRSRPWFLGIVLSPLLINMVSLTMGWMIIFRGHGILNRFTLWAGITSIPIRYMYDIKGVIICLIYIGTPYMIMCLLDSLSRIDPYFEEAAQNIGAKPLQIFLKITLPLSVPGLFAGSLVVFSIAFSAFSIPFMIGSDRTPMIGVVIYDQAMQLSNQPFASAISVIIILITLIIMYTYFTLFNKFFFRKLGI